LSRQTPPSGFPPAFRRQIVDFATRTPDRSRNTPSVCSPRLEHAAMADLRIGDALARPFTTAIDPAFLAT
jgi:hypothetical protein